MQELLLRKKSFILIVLFVLLLVGLIFFATENYFLRKQINYSGLQADSCQVNSQTVGFLKFFTEKVLNSQQEVSFEDRLRLENMVRDLGDESILSAWNNFTQAKTSDEAQEYCKSLLLALVKKIMY